MYYVINSTSKYDSTLPGLNILEVEIEKSNEGFIKSYKVINILIGGLKSPKYTSISTSDKHMIFDNKRGVIKIIFNLWM